jgi:hypothetical protein
LEQREDAVLLDINASAKKQLANLVTRLARIECSFDFRLKANTRVCVRCIEDGLLAVKVVGESAHTVAIPNSIAQKLRTVLALAGNLVCRRGETVTPIGAAFLRVENLDALALSSGEELVE